MLIVLLPLFCLVSGTGIPVGNQSPRGTEMGEKCPPTAFAGTGTGKFSRHGDGDGGSIPDGEFPIAILSLEVVGMPDLASLASPRATVCSAHC